MNLTELIEFFNRNNIPHDYIIEVIPEEVKEYGRLVLSSDDSLIEYRLDDARKTVDLNSYATCRF